MNERRPQPISALIRSHNTQATISQPTQVPCCRGGEVIAAYGSFENFKTWFSPIKQARLCSDVAKVFDNTAPPIVSIARAYGLTQTELFVASFIDDLCQYTSVKGKMTPKQMHETAAVIVSGYGYLTMAEILYFFYLFKAGRFGRFYGAVDSLVITNALREFLDVRDAELDRIERRKRQERRIKEEERRRRECLTYEEYEELKWLFNMGYESPT